ncbi:MAG: hypothetical protein HY292_08015 [Planctomycetes bacterium]|nr:hypothetical protein [Planctomycetota bacterium]
MRRSFQLWLVIAVLGLGPATCGLADDRKFTFSTEAKTLPKGVWEFEQWATLQESKDSGRWTTLLFREEIEYGITDRLNAAFYLNASYQDNSNVDGFEDEHSFGFDSNSVELKYKLTDPSTDAVGSLVYGELLLSHDEYEFEGKAVFSKEMGPWTLAYNFVWEEVLARADDPLASPEWRSEHEISNTLGASYGVAPRWAFGIEGFGVSRFDRSLGGDQTHATFAGPNVHYSSDDWWATLTVARQLDVDGLDFTDGDNTKWVVRLIIGVNF